MRSHAKASTAGSTQRQATGLGRIFRGVLATDGGSFRVEGSSAPAAKRLALPAGVFAAILVLVIVAGSASAANGVVNFFGGNGVTGGKFAELNSGPGGVAVNQEGTGGATAGDVYVVDRGNNRIQQFTAAGAFVRAFGLSVGGAGVHVCTVAASCAAGTASAEAGGMSNPQGIAIDQANGNVFVTDQNNRRVDVFSANGTFKAAFGYGVDTSAAALELCTTASSCAAGSSGANAGQFGAQIGYLAVAPAGSPNAGHVYVADKSNRRVDQFQPTLTAGEVTGIAFVKGWGWGVDTGASEFQQCTTASVCEAPNTSSPTTNPGQFGSNQPQALAVDSNGNVYTAESAGNNRAQKFDSTGHPVAFSAPELTGSPGPNDIAVDKTNNRVFAIKEVSGTNERRVFEFNSSGAFIATHASGTTITSANGLAVVQGTTNFYLTTNQSSNFRGVFFLGTKVNPTATVEAPSPLSAHSATLKGKVNPQGFETAYRFEFSSDGGSTWTKIPAADVSLGGGTSDIPVSQEVNGLIGGHEYRYKIVATKPFGAGSATSSTQIFTTPASAPTVLETFSRAVTTSSAILGARINPNHQATAYRFEYGTADCSINPCTSIPLSDAGVGSGGNPVEVANEVMGLQPGTTYHYRVVATNPTGATEGPDTTFTTYANVAPSTDCPNEGLRGGASANLPNCRAYELVSPLDKNGADIVAPAEFSFDQGSVSGDKIAYGSYAAFGDPEAGAFVSMYLGTRGPDGWGMRELSPPRGPYIGATLPVIASEFKAFSPDLSSAWIWHNAKPTLVPEAVENYVNIYRQDTASKTYEALTTVKPPNKPAQQTLPEFQGASRDGRHALIQVSDSLVPGAPVTPGEEMVLYEWVDGDLRLVAVLPNGEPSPLSSSAGTRNGASVFGDEHSVDHAISDDGSRIFWSTSVAGNRKLYVRIDGKETVAVSESVSAGNAQFHTASADGSIVIFTMEGSGDDLYEFNVDTETPTLIAEDALGVMGASDDAAHVYFASKEILDTGATAGQVNLYHRHGGSVDFIGTLTVEEGFRNGSANGAPRPLWDRPKNHNARVTADGRHAVFVSQADLTGYDNRALGSGQAAAEVYRYDADSDELTCVSCNPSGARPLARQLAFEAGSYFAAASIGRWKSQLYDGRNLSEDGDRVFFDAIDALVPQDTNGAMDVYQWEAQGSGDCTEAGGCVSLLSTGKSPSDSEFVDADAEGNDVFLRTESNLDPRDRGSVDIYDARVGGGYPYLAPEEACVGDACQSPPPPPRDPTPASAGFRGSGDPNPRKLRDCRTPAKRVAKLLSAAKRLSRQAGRASSPQRAKVLRRRSHRLSRQAERVGKSVERCRRANRKVER